MKRILIVDDSRFMRMKIKDILMEQGYHVVGEAVNGEEAVEKYQQLQPDIVTMDITMSKLQGIDALRIIKVLNPQAKVVMVSARGAQYLIKEALQAGARDFIVKPFKDDKVIECFNKL